MVDFKKKRAGFDAAKAIEEKFKARTLGTIDAFPDSKVCTNCGGIHKGSEYSDFGYCHGPHSPVCYCARCRGVTPETWHEKQRNPGGAILVNGEEDPFTNEETEQMIQVQRNNQMSEGSSTPKGVQFLSPKHVTSPSGFRATITKVTTDKPDNFGNPYVVYFQNERDKYSKGFKPTSHLLISLVDMLGEDEQKWLKKEIIVNKITDDEGGERLVFALPTETGKKGKERL